MRGMARAVPGEPEHGVVDREVVDTIADGDHDAGQVTPLAGRKRGRKAVPQGPGSNLRLSRIDPRRLYRHDHLTGGRHRHGHVGDVEHVPVAVAVEEHCPSCLRHLILLTQRGASTPTDRHTPGRTFAPADANRTSLRCSRALANPFVARGRSTHDRADQPAQPERQAGREESEDELPHAREDGTTPGQQRDQRADYEQA